MPQYQFLPESLIKIQLERLRHAWENVGYRNIVRITLYEYSALYIAHAVTCIKQAFNYIKRLESLKHGHHETLARNALIEQENLSLPWFKRLRELQEQLNMNRSLDAAKALSNIESKFKRLWTSAMPLNSKLHFYNIVKGGRGSSP